MAQGEKFEVGDYIIYHPMKGTTIPGVVEAVEPNGRYKIKIRSTTTHQEREMIATGAELTLFDMGQLKK